MAIGCGHYNEKALNQVIFETMLAIFIKGYKTFPNAIEKTPILMLYTFYISAIHKVDSLTAILSTSLFKWCTDFYVHFLCNTGYYLKWTLFKGVTLFFSVFLAICFQIHGSRAY